MIHTPCQWFSLLQYLAIVSLAKQGRPLSNWNHHCDTESTIRYWQELTEVLAKHRHRNSPVHRPEFPRFHEGDTQLPFSGHWNSGHDRLEHIHDHQMEICLSRKPIASLVFSLQLASDISLMFYVSDFCHSRFSLTLVTTCDLFLENRGYTHRCKTPATLQATCLQSRCDQPARRAHPL